MEKVPFDIREKKLKVRIGRRNQFKTHYKKLTSEAKADHEQGNLSQNGEHQYEVMNAAEEYTTTYFATELKLRFALISLIHRIDVIWYNLQVLLN